MKANPQLSLGVAVAFFGTKAAAAVIALLLLFDVGRNGRHIDSASFGITRRGRLDGVDASAGAWPSARGGFPRMTWVTRLVIG